MNSMQYFFIVALLILKKNDMIIFNFVEKKFTVQNETHALLDLHPQTDNRIIIKQ